MVLCGISTPFGVLFPCLGKVAHALLTRPPLKQLIASYSLSPLDLHVLGTPPAFVLSQDQTLSFNPLSLNQVPPDQVSLIRNYCLVCVVIVLYRFQGSVLSLGRSSGATRKPVHNIMNSRIRQAVFSKFLRFFAFFLESRTLLQASKKTFRRFLRFGNAGTKIIRPFSPVLRRESAPQSPRRGTFPPDRTRRSVRV